MTATALQRVVATVPRSHLNAFHAAIVALHLDAGAGIVDGQSISFRLAGEPGKISALQDALLCFPGIQIS